MSMIKRILCLCMILLSQTGDLCAQSSAGVGFGYSVYKGDLSQPGIFGDFSLAGPAFNAFYKLQLQKSIRLRANIFIGQINGDDSRSDQLAQQRRNLSFSNTIHELSVLGEYNFSNEYIGGSPLSFYATGGLGVYKSNPKTIYNGIEYELRPLMTENQTQPYGLYHPVFILGGGMEIELNDAISLKVELLGRITNNDYIDDVSGMYPNYEAVLMNNGTLSAALSDRRDEFLGLPEGTTDIQGTGNVRGNPNSRDYYISMMVNLLVRINNQDYSGKNRKRILCPNAR